MSNRDEATDRSATPPFLPADTEGEHTPGEWRVQDGFLTIYSVVGCATQAIAKVVYDDPHTPVSPCVPKEQAEANARLIAAAPETAAERDRLRAVNAELVEALRNAAQAMRSIGVFSSSHKQMEWWAAEIKAACTALQHARSPEPKE